MKWKKKAVEKKRIDVADNIEALQDFLQDVAKDTQELRKLFQQLDELEKERTIAKPGILHINLETQAKVLDGLLKRYEFFLNDVSINGERLKLIKDAFLKHAAKAGLKDLIKEKEHEQHWKGSW